MFKYDFCVIVLKLILGMVQKNLRIIWKDESVDKTFIEACLHEVIINRREVCSLKAVSWKNVGEMLKMNIIG